MKLCQSLAKVMQENCEKVNVRKRKNLTMQKKIEIINCVKKGESKKNVAKMFDVGASTVSDICKQEDKIQQMVGSNKGSYLSKKKRNSKVRYPFLERKVLEWYENARKSGIFITGPMISKKAIDLFKESGNEGNFQASKGWLSAFKSRNGIKLNGQMEVTSSQTPYDQNAINSFTDHLQTLIQFYNLTPEQIYNADETDLFWKLMPKPSIFDKDELQSSKAAYRERMTLLACTNSTGSHKLPLVCIGRKSQGITSDDIFDLPLVYYSQETAWMDTNIFHDWYHNIFVPSVREHLKLCGLPEVALLIIDQNPSHPNTEFLKTDDNSFNVLYLSADIKASLQPMQLGIFHDLKSFYRYQLMSDMIDKKSIFEDYEEHLSFIDSLKMLGASWDSISELRIQQAFSKILKIDYLDMHECEINSQSFAYLIELIPECILYNYTLDRLNNWLVCDNVDCQSGYENSNNYSGTEMDTQNNEESYTFKEVSESDEYVILEEIGSSDDNLVPNKSDQLSENIEDILTKTQEEFLENELKMINEDDFLEPDVTADDALKAVDTILRFVKNEPTIDSKNVEFLLGLKDTISYRLSDV